jgi:hypothetical protein
MDILILIIICIGLIIHRHLSTFWESGNLPYARGFILYFKIFSILNFINFIWIFGFVVGPIVAVLAFYQIIFSSFLWPFLVPGLIINNQKEDIAFMQARREPSKLVYGGWTYLIIGLLILTIINFFVGSYSSLTIRILEQFRENIKIIGLYVVICVVIGNLLRIITMKLLTRL